ncbi:MAG: cytochrome-c oxidase, cbb3-type subunit I, partial [Hyphomicrobium sp.]
MDNLLSRVFVWLAVALVALFAAIGAADQGFAVHMAIVAASALLVAGVTMQRADYAVLTGLAPSVTADQGRYDDDVIRLGVLATLFWGVVGMLVGVIIATQMVYPELNYAPYFSFG